MLFIIQVYLIICLYGLVIRDESGNGKFPYRPTPNTGIPDQISFSREKTDSGRNPGKFGEFRIKIG